MRFEFFVALRYLKAKRRQAALSVVTAISVIGVMAGVAALVIALAINNGFRRELQDKLLGATANVNLIRTENDGIRHYDALADRLAKVPHVVADAPALYEQALIANRQRSSGVVIKGIDPDRELRVCDLLHHLTEGSIEGLNQTFPDADPIIVGKGLAKSLGVTVGDTVMIVSPQGTLTPFEVVPKYRHFRVVGVFDSGFYDFDASWVFTNLNAAQRLFDLQNVASVIEFKLDDVYKADAVAETILEAAGHGFSTTTWMDQNHALFSALKLERLVTILTIGLIVLVAALNIFITLAMMVMDKNRDIAILKSMGARNRQIWRVFTLHGILIACVGTVLGLVLGYGGSWLGEAYRLVPLPADVYGLSFVPFIPRPWDGLWISLAVLAISFLASFYPSSSAARVDSAEILRYE
ncbi:MAG TPA: FtsX-like permease family protein [Terriglobia bacterium]|nr:FtsX-like permease family protein [Terriglobia bacterium]